MNKDGGERGGGLPLALGNMLNTVKTVLSAFLGIRRRSEHDEDTVKLKPIQIIVTGLLAAAIFVVGLILLARFIISSATA